MLLIRLILIDVVFSVIFDHLHDNGHAYFWRRPELSRKPAIAGH